MDRRNFRQLAADGWLNICRQITDPIKAWEDYHTPERLSETEPVLGTLSVFLQPIQFIVEHGTSETLAREITTLQSVNPILRRHRRPPFQRPIWGKITAGIEVEIDWFEAMYRAAVKAEELLRKHGWKFDPTTGRVSVTGKRKGQELLVRMFQRLGVEYGHTAKARRRIKRELAPFFDVDAGPRGNIARALENMKRLSLCKQPDPSKR